MQSGASCFRGLVAPPVLLLGLLLVLQGCSPKAHDTVVASVGNEDITLGEYEALYIKSNGSREHGEKAGLEDREHFLDLMINYRLKLAEAHDRGMHLRRDVQEEIAQYEGSLAQSFITGREIVSPGVRELYDRKSEEIRASHILIGLKPNPTAVESTEAYTKIYEIITQAQAGTDFGLLAEQFSTDPTAKENKGDLYYFTAGQMVRPFEDAAYAMQKGDLSQTPVRTQYGLHVIRITDRRPASGEVHCGHIMKRFARPAPTPDDTGSAHTRISAIRDSIANGEDFAGLARRNSDDHGSASKGGDLGWFARRRWIQPFDEVALSLQPGELSGIVRTPFGYHIIKCYERRPWKSFEESQEEIKTLYRRLRFQDDYQEYLEGLKQELQYSRNDTVVAQFFVSLDSSKTTRDSAWASMISPSLGASTILSLAGERFPVDTVVALIEGRRDLGTVRLTASNLFTVLDKIAEQLLFAAKAERLKKTDPEFASIVHEYTEGVLLYQAEQENVWEKVQATDSLLHDYFVANREKFRYPERVIFTEIRSSSEAGGRAIHTKLVSGLSPADVAEQDSVRMAALTKFEASFARRSSRLNRTTITLLSSVAADLRKDSTLRVRILAQPDTTQRKSQTLRMASRRLVSLHSQLVKALGIDPSRIDTLSKPQGSPAANNQHTISLGLTGRRPLVIGAVTSATLAPEADERAHRADSLATGEFGEPFHLKGNYVIVRLDGRTPARLKTFEEAGPEVSTAFQDYESKRIEALWLEKLRKKYPVVRHNEVLNIAFAEVR
ncbi:MAG: peptidylprolyl isomerase [Bacteroidota bacterium]